MPQWEKMTCSKCGRLKKETEFFKYRDGTRCDLCKTCLTMYIDNYKPETFLWILEKFDIPYIEDVWVKLTNKIYLKNPAKFGPSSVIGQYLRTVKNMAQYSDTCFADSDRINYENQKEKEKAELARAAAQNDENYEEDLKTKLENGEISEAEYQTLSRANVVDTDETTPRVASVGFLNGAKLDESNITDELTESDIKYLALKWGVAYPPMAWIKMEEKYQKYAEEYELDTDREDVLKKICKVSLKMDEALDAEDFAAFQKLSNTYDQLRKSAKFTEVQNKEEQKREIDSLGELVRFVEREGGIIPNSNDPLEYPKDKIDFVIKDMQNYVSNLVKNELGLGEIIESFIEKMEKQKEQTVEDIIRSGLSDVEEDDYLSEEDVVEYSKFRVEEAEEEAQKLLEKFE